FCLQWRLFPASTRSLHFPRHLSRAMQFRYVLLLVGAAFFAGGNAAMATMDSQLSAAKVRRIPAKRVLRALNEEPDDGEERGPSISVSISQSLRNWINKAAPKLLLNDDEILVLASKAEHTPIKVLKTLELDTGLDGILRNPNLKSFSRYLELRGEDPTKALVATLIKQYGDTEVAKYLFDVKHNSKIADESIKKHADILLGAQYAKWADDGVTPRTVGVNFDHYPETWGKNPYEKVWWEYLDVWAERESKKITKRNKTRK
ncbi:hypothetical protein L917_02727, partial [Phytophthora nicotianae]